MTPGRSKALILVLLVAVVALIAYGSLYPFNFKRDAVPGGLLDALQQLSWARAGRGDRVSNILLYVPLGFCLFLLFNSGRRWLAVLAAVVVGAMLSLAIEVAQAFISPRVPSLTDLSLNTLGTLAGTVAGSVWRTLSRLIHFPTVGGNRGDRLAVSVILLWLAWRFFPFIPSVSLAKLKAALEPLFRPEFELGAVYVYLACWLVVGQAVFVLASRQGGTEALLVLIAGVLAGRLLVADQVFIPSELLALILLLPILVVLNRLSGGIRRGVLLAVLATAFAAERLAPFEFTPARGHFDWWPFLSWIDAGMPIDAAGLLALLFFCAGLTWLLKDLGMALKTAGYTVTAYVSGLELLELWQPAGEATISAPVLAFAFTLLLGNVGTSQRTHSYGRSL